MSRDPDAELDPETLALCRDRHPAALRAFVERYERPVFALLSRLLGESADVEDLAQETFLRALRALPSFDPAGAARPSTWLLTIATRLALDRMRQRSRATRAVVAPAEPADTPSPEQQAEGAELRRAIARAVDALPADQRAAFVLTEFHDCSMDDVARVLNVPKSTLKTRLFRAREKLARALRQTRGGP